MTKAYTTLNVVKHGLRSVNRTNLLSHQSNCLHTADDVLVYLAQPFETVCRIILETLLYFWTFFGTI